MMIRPVKLRMASLNAWSGGGGVTSRDIMTKLGGEFTFNDITDSNAQYTFHSAVQNESLT